MADDKAEVLMIGPVKKLIADGLNAAFKLHVMATAKDGEALLAEIAPRVRAIASSAPSAKADRALIRRLPRLEIISSFGVGYDNIDIKAAVEHKIVVANTPQVLTEEVADTALGLLLCTVREFPQADRFVRAGKWKSGDYPLSKATLRNRIVGMAGLGQIGKAIARRLDAFGVPVVYHSRSPQKDVGYRYYPKLVDMARDVDTLIVITPGGPATRNLINAEVLAALGPNGILINMARGSVVDERALIKALEDRTIYSAGLDVFVNEPQVPAELLAMDHIVLFPHLGSSSQFTRAKMEQLVVDNLLAWQAGKPPLTPLPETPWAGWKG
ncbi:MAG: 2-hydroxyacid dehydrogenase [Rhizobiales bacterium]|nr:2-hydroxyacid dehydrogenase [Hyphomicrobiales bacterium]